MLIPEACPICLHEPVERLLDEFKLTAAIGNHVSVVGGLLAYRCVPKGHIFFLRQYDIETWKEMVESEAGRRFAEAAQIQ